MRHFHRRFSDTNPDTNPDTDTEIDIAMTARPAAVPRQLEESDRVLVTEWRFPPGGETGWHRHGMDYVVVYRTAARLQIESATGTVSMQLSAGDSYFRRAGVEHNVINASEDELIFVEVEIK